MFFKKKNSANIQNAQNDDRIKVDTSTITTMVGIDTVIKGELITKSSVRINGTVEGDVRADGIVILTKTGRIIGTIEAESIIVAGVVEGNMSIRDKVNVEASGAIYGEVITKKFVIDEESIFQGNCIMNRDGKVIPVPPYKKKDEEDKKEEPEDKEKKEKKESKKEDSKDKESDENNSKKDDEVKADESDDKEKESEDESIRDDSEEDESNAEEKESSKESEKSDDDNASEDESSEKTEDSSDEKKKDEKTDDTIIIADINEVEAAEDIPASDGDINRKNKRHNKNYVKKSKSLSVEVES